MLSYALINSHSQVSIPGPMDSQLPLKVGYHQPARKIPFKFSLAADDGPTLNAGLIEIQTNIAKEPFTFVVFQGVKTPCPISGSVNGMRLNAHPCHKSSNFMHWPIYISRFILFFFQITITDVNDNCPVLTPTTVTLTPIPVLVQTAYATFATTDADSGENADIHYVVSAITEEYVSQIIDNR